VMDLESVRQREPSRRTSLSRTASFFRKLFPVTTERRATARLLALASPAQV